MLKPAAGDPAGQLSNWQGFTRGVAGVSEEPCGTEKELAIWPSGGPESVGER